jgi:hypothetical protein
MPFETARCLEVGRAIKMTDAQGGEIVCDRYGGGKIEASVKLNAIGSAQIIEHDAVPSARLIRPKVRPALYRAAPLPLSLL